MQTYCDVNELLSALLLGIATGERAFLGPAALAWSGETSELTRGFLTLTEAGELVGDILPATPARSSAPPLLARLVSGASVGLVIAKRTGSSQLATAAAGVVGAAIGTFAGQAARARAIEAIGAVPAALAEDVVAIGLAAGASSLLRSR